jgi:hypothetical protein
MASARRIALLLAASLAACAAPRGARAPLRTEVSHFAGTVLSGPTGEPSPAELASGALGLRLRIALVPHAADGEVLPARLIVAENAADPFVTRSELAAGARLSQVAAPSESLWATQVEEALLRGGTMVLSVEPERTLPEGPRPGWDRLELELSRRSEPGEQLDCALVLTARARLSGPVASGPEGQAPEQPELRERILLDGAPQPGGSAWSFAFPAPSASEPDLTLLVEVQVLAAADPAAVERAVAKQDAARRERESDESAPGAESLRIQTGSAVQALARRDLQRPALLYLAGETRAELLSELALTLDAEPLGDLLQAVREGLAQQPDALEAEQLGWILERASWHWVLARASEQRDAEDHVPGPLDALLLQLAGEAGRWPDFALDALAQSADAQAFAARLEEENLIFLEDADPAARVRAWDWLAARGRAPAGFDPLASSAERRAALAALREASDQQSGQ